MEIEIKVRLDPEIAADRSKARVARNLLLLLAVRLVEASVNSDDRGDTPQS